MVLCAYVLSYNDDVKLLSKCEEDQFTDNIVWPLVCIRDEAVVLQGQTTDH